MRFRPIAPGTPLKIEAMRFPVVFPNSIQHAPFLEELLDPREREHAIAWWNNAMARALRTPRLRSDYLRNVIDAQDILSMIKIMRSATPEQIPSILTALLKAQPQTHRAPRPHTFLWAYLFQINSGSAHDLITLYARLEDLPDTATLEHTLLPHIAARPTFYNRVTAQLAPAEVTRWSQFFNLPATSKHALRKLRKIANQAARGRAFNANPRKLPDRAGTDT